MLTPAPTHTVWLASVRPCVTTGVITNMSSYRYADIRGVDMALKKSDLHQLDLPSSSKQPCTSFGLHPDLPFLASMYNSGDLALVARIDKRPLPSAPPKNVA